MKKLFGTDGVRGVANVYPMTTEMAMQLGRAAAYIFRSTSKRRHRIEKIEAWKNEASGSNQAPEASSATPPAPAA